MIFQIKEERRKKLKKLRVFFYIYSQIIISLVWNGSFYIANPQTSSKWPEWQWLKGKYSSERLNVFPTAGKLNFSEILIINDRFILAAGWFNCQKRSLLNYVSVKISWCLRLLCFYFLLKMLFQLVLSFKWTNLCKSRNNACKYDITFGNKSNQIKGEKKKAILI